MPNPTQNLQSPVGELQWVFISGKGKKNLKDDDVFAASLVLPENSEACAWFISELEKFWKENKPSKIKAPKSLGYKALKDDEDNETGYISFNFWTGITFPDGSPKKVKVYNAKGAEVSLGTKKIGNESVGRIGGAMGIYELKAEAGVTLYLNSIQLKKFVEYTGGDNFDAIDDDDEDAFTSVEDDGMDALSESEDTDSEAPAKPRL